MWHVRIFDQLIYNVDRNLGNLVIDKSWTVWMIDHSRAFRLFDKLKSPKDLRKIERGALERLKALDAPTLKAAVGNYLTPDERSAMLHAPRRDREAVESADPTRARRGDWDCDWLSMIGNSPIALNRQLPLANCQSRAQSLHASASTA